MKQKLIVLASISILFIISFVWKASAEAPDLSPQDRYSAALDGWLTSLATCESKDKAIVNPKDSDGLPAFGYFQYKLTTVISFAKKYNVYPNVTADSAYTIAMDKEKAYHLTKEVMRQNPDEYKQWGRNCRDQAGKPPTLEDYLKG